MFTEIIFYCAFAVAGFPKEYRIGISEDPNVAIQVCDNQRHSINYPYLENLRVVAERGPDYWIDFGDLATIDTRLQAYTFYWQQPPTLEYESTVTFCDDGTAVMHHKAPVVEPLALEAGVTYNKVGMCPSNCYYQVAFANDGSIINQSDTQCLGN